MHTTAGIISCAPNAMMEIIHDRMPAILGERDETEWLDPELPLEGVQSLIQPYLAKTMEMVEVTRGVNNAWFNAPVAIAPKKGM